MLEESKGAFKGRMWDWSRTLKNVLALSWRKGEEGFPLKMRFGQRQKISRCFEKGRREIAIKKDFNNFQSSEALFIKFMEAL